jgi:hypothetical protein
MAKRRPASDRDDVEEVQGYLSETVIAAIRQVDASFDSASLLEAIVRHFGGIEKVALKLSLEYDALGRQPGPAEDPGTH